MHLTSPSHTIQKASTGRISGIILTNLHVVQLQWSAICKNVTGVLVVYMERLKKFNNFVYYYYKCLTPKGKDNFGQNLSLLCGVPNLHSSNVLENNIKKWRSEYIRLLQVRILKRKPIITSPACRTSLILSSFQQQITF